MLSITTALPSFSQPGPAPIYAEIVGDDFCQAVGLTARSTSPVLALCRKLLEAGFDPKTRLEAYRGDVLCLHVRSIGEAARLEVNSGGTGFKWAREPRPRPVVRLNHLAATTPSRSRCGRVRAMTEREKLPKRRISETFDIDVNGRPYRVSFSRYADGRLAEIFISNNRVNSDSDTAAKDSAVVCSIALQFGVPLETIRRGLMRDSSGRPSGPLGVALDILAGRENVES
jgi:ribonucleoside-diphosphate reductase alpha chain